jgi:transitional endoplasmic reticulum ATPase
MYQGFSGADISKVCREAGMFALNDDINATYVNEGYLLKAIQITKPTITKEMLENYEYFLRKNEL